MTMKIMNSKKTRYRVYMLSVIVLILVVFNLIFTFQIHKKLVSVVSNPGRWPVGSYIYDRTIGFDFAPDISGYIGDGSFYVKSHHLGYRIGQHTDATAYQPGGLLSLGCSFTYGDEVDAGQTFTQLAADGLNIPAYNYGICSFSYIHALLKARQLKEQGLLDKLKPEYVVLGCWNGLPARSRSPFPPLASDNLPLPSAYLARDGQELIIKYPMKLQHVFEMVELYREEGTAMSLKKLSKLFFAAPRYVYLYIRNNRMAQEMKMRNLQQEVSDFQVYDFYFSGIEEVFSSYGVRILVLYMPNSFDEPIARALKEAVARHPGITLVDGLQAIHAHGVSGHDYVRKHPQPAAHRAYAMEIINTVLEF